MNVLSAHQPQFIPWLGFFSKIHTANKYVVLDDLKYSKSSFQTRNSIRVSGAKKTDILSIPIIKDSTKESFKLVEIDMKKNWQIKHLKSIKFAYSKSKFFKEIYTDLERIYFNNTTSNLLSFNMQFINYGIKIFKINSKIYFNSEIKEKGFNTRNKKAKFLCDLTEYLGCDFFLFGSNGKKYFQIDDNEYFKSKKIKPIYQIYNHPVYKQIQGEFLPNCTFLDLLFNYGKNECSEFFKKSNYESLN